MSETAQAAVDAGPAGGAVGLLVAGGPVVGILVAMSVAALAIVLVKCWQFQAARIGERRAARAALSLYHGGRPLEALSRLEAGRDPLSRVLAVGLRGRLDRRGEPATLRETVDRIGSDILEELRGYFRSLEVIASLAPLLGLFGTVLGMIDAFRQLEQAGSQVSPSILSGGIWVALLTTAVGLAVAMPAVVALNWLERRVERLAHDMDSSISELFTHDAGFEAALPERTGHAAFRAAGE